jgi:L-alanine-DL-glutamate epimerase-like enolase superfamily enzyme
MKNRRDFIKQAGLTTIFAGGMSTISFASVAEEMKTFKGKMKLKFQPYTLQLKHVFTIASNSRSTTPVMLVQVEYEGLTGFGEASMPPYLGETHESVSKFLSKVNLSSFNGPFELEKILTYIDAIAPGNRAAKASVDIALHDLLGKMMKRPWHEIWGYDPSSTPSTSFTIGIDTPEIVRKKVQEASPYNILKVKLGRETDREMISTIREVTDKPICVDVNQGWKDRSFALDMAHWLKSQNIIFIEQPMPKEQIDDMAWLTENSPLPTIGDESVQRLDDVLKAHHVYSGINIKLMKSTGMREAHKMIVLAKALGMKVMIGCMTETSCAISAASQLSPMADWADLDGALLISNDPYKGMQIDHGKIQLSNLPGIGVTTP